MFSIKDLHVFYGKFCALKIQGEIKFGKNDFVGVIGSNGAGKSTMIKACLNLIPYKGEIKFDIPDCKIAVHMQDNEYLETVSVASVLKGLLGVKPGKDEKLDNLIDFFNFKKCLHKKYKNLSGGQKQRLTLIMVLYSDSPITLFDEVTTGLDFETRQQLMDKIKSWYKHKESTVLLVTHYYDELENLANKLLILDNGRVVDYGKVDDLFKKYVGHCAIVVSNINKDDINNFHMIKAPDNKVAFRCDNIDEEKKICEYLIKNQLNFGRTDKNIELIHLNALASLEMSE